MKEAPPIAEALKKERYTRDEELRLHSIYCIQLDLLEIMEDWPRYRRMEIMNIISEEICGKDPDAGKRHRR